MIRNWINKMDKVREVVNNPALLEEKLKEFFNKADVDKKGYITHEQYKEAAILTAKELNLPKPEKEPTPEELEQAKKIVDPEGNGKITFENFRKFSLVAIEEAKKRGKL